MKSDLQISISIVSHGDLEKITRLLASLQTHEETKKIELILTDNLNNQLPEFDATLWASLYLIRNEQELGFAQNHNNAFKLAKGKYFVVLNPDLIFEKPIFEHLIHTLNTYQMDLIAPKIVDADGVIQDSFRRLPNPLQLMRRRLLGEKIESFQVDAHGVIHPDWIAGMFWLMQSETYHQLNGMDEKFRLYFEDVDFCTRARLSGLKILVDTTVQVQHHAQRSSRKKLYYFFLHSLSAARFFLSPVYWQASRMK